MGNCLRKASSLPTGSGGGDGLGGRAVEPTLRQFTLAELRRATQDFKKELILGEGGFGRVYKGWVEEAESSASTSSFLGGVVAVKRLNPESVQGAGEWQAEVAYLGGLEHPNVVKLVGQCNEERELLLVYEYLAQGSLADQLFKEGTAATLEWPARLEIAIGTARGLAFLHSQNIIYRDLKSANVLLDDAFKPKLSDLGLARTGPDAGSSHVTTRVMGTHGYAAPEYVATGHLYLSSDVYSFGVVLAELLTGRRAIDLSRPAEQVNLLPWALPFLAGEQPIQQIMDGRLAGGSSFKAFRRVAKVAHSCVCQDRRSRPKMNDVLASLEHIRAV